MVHGGLTAAFCFKELDRFPHYFLSIFGERYGWHQEIDGTDIALTSTLAFAEDQGYPPFSLLVDVA